MIPPRIIEEVSRERARQACKWGHVRRRSLFLWTTILAEEVGEFARAAHDAKYGGRGAGRARSEAVQVAAVALAIVEDLDRRGGAGT